jgi:HAD superfamily hydrolase (TIGR01549 family)
VTLKAKSGRVPQPEGRALLDSRSSVRAILFDLDGTLIDTDDAFLEAAAARIEPWRRALRLPDARPFLRRATVAAEGPVNSVVTLLDILGLDDNLLSIGDKLRRVRGLQVRGQFVPVHGAIQTLRQLTKSYHLGLVTTRSRLDTESFVDQFGLGSLLDVVITREDTRRLKPHPQPVLQASDCLGLAPSRCVMVGDTRVDIVSAKAAGAYAVGVLCGFGEREELLKAGADLILDDPSQLRNWL